jgi:RND superfamily putative drug exporter
VGVLILVSLGVAFKSIIVPLWSLISIVITLAWTYAIATVVYSRNTIFTDTEVGDYSGIAWILPVLTVSIVIGFALDYDVFAFNYIFEYSRSGFSAIESIRQGQHKTGKIITAAGLVMTVALAAMVINPSLPSRTFGFLLTVSVLFDTLVVRLIIAPVVLGVLADWHVWPASQMP